MQKRLAVATLMMFGSVGGAFAECNSMWLTRNIVFDRAGYCFGSNLGQSVFNNAGCTGTDVTLGAADQDFVNYTRQMEDEFQCSIDTSAKTLDLELIGSWMQLADLPRRDLWESSCIGWIGPSLPLRAAANDTSTVLGQVSPGDDIGLSHVDINEFSFAEITRDGTLVAIGWIPAEFIGPMTCSDMAG